MEKKPLKQQLQIRVELRTFVGLVKPQQFVLNQSQTLICKRTLYKFKFIIKDYLEDILSQQNWRVKLKKYMSILNLKILFKQSKKQKSLHLCKLLIVKYSQNSMSYQKIMALQMSRFRNNQENTEKKLLSLDYMPMNICS